MSTMGPFHLDVVAEAPSLSLRSPELFKKALKDSQQFHSPFHERNVSMFKRLLNDNVTLVTMLKMSASICVCNGNYKP